MIFYLIFQQITDDFGFVEELWIFDVGVLDFECDLFVGFVADGFVDLAKGTGSEFFCDCELFGDDSINHWGESI